MVGVQGFSSLLRLDMTTLKQEQERAREQTKDNVSDYCEGYKDCIEGELQRIDTLVAQAYRAGADAMMEGVEERRIANHDNDYDSKKAHNDLVQKLKEKRSNI